jgi:hypothetical protein
MAIDLRLGGGQSSLRASRYEGALLLSERSIQVEHERVCVGAEFGDDERDPLRHKADNERLSSADVHPESLGRAYPRDLADAIAFSLRFEGRKHFHQADEYMAAIAPGRVVRHLDARALSS